MEPLRIAFSGASGTGKTTLATRLAEQLNLPFCPVGSRSVAKGLGFVGADGAGRPYDVDRADLPAYVAVLRKAGVNVEDPTALTRLDPELAVAAAREARAWWSNSHETTAKGSCRPLFQRTLQAAKIAWEQAQIGGYVTDRTTIDDLAYLVLSPGGQPVADAAFVERATNHTRRYTLTFFAPIAAFQKLGDDPARVTEPGYHAVHEMILVGGLRASAVPVYDLPAGGLENRWDFVQRTLAVHLGA